jgi:SecD/SecF fusion protein
VALGQKATVEQVRNTLTPLGLSDAKIQTLSNPDLGRNVVQISPRSSARTASRARRTR